MTDRLYVIVAVDQKCIRAATALSIDDRITVAYLKISRADADTLHHLFDRLGGGAHSCTARGYRGHAAKCLQALGKALRMTINISIKASKTHNL